MMALHLTLTRFGVIQPKGIPPRSGSQPCLVCRHGYEQRRNEGHFHYHLQFRSRSHKFAADKPIALLNGGYKA